MSKAGTGVLTLSGDSGLDWMVKVGGLVSAAERFDGDVAIRKGAAFSFDQAANAAYAGQLSGNGDFVKNGVATLMLTGNSGTFTGLTRVKDRKSTRLNSSH